MHLVDLDLLLWAFGLLGHITLLCVLWLRHRAAQFPIFTTFVTANVVRTVVLYFTFRHGSKHVYFSVYWSLAVLDVAVQLLIVYELASHVFRPLGKWAKDVRRGFVCLGAASLGIAAILTWLAAPGTRTWIQLVVIRGSFFSAVLMSELFTGMVILSVTAGLPWKTHVARISQALGVYSLLCILIEATNSYFGVGHKTRAYHALAHVRMFAYLACVAYWTVTLWRDAPEPRSLPEEVYRRLLLLQDRVACDLERVRTWRS